MPRIPERIQINGEIVTGDVWINGKPLSLGKRLGIENLSPSGFSWGYQGSGPAQLALLLRYLSRRDAVYLHQENKRDVIARLPQTDIDTEIPVGEWLETQKNETRQINLFQEQEMSNGQGTQAGLASRGQPAQGVLYFNPGKDCRRVSAPKGKRWKGQGSAPESMV